MTEVESIVFIYGMETTLTEKSAEKLRVTQGAIESSMPGITLMHRKGNERIREKTNTCNDIDDVQEIEMEMGRGHIARLDTQPVRSKIA